MAEQQALPGNGRSAPCDGDAARCGKHHNKHHDKPADSSTAGLSTGLPSLDHIPTEHISTDHTSTNHNPSEHTATKYWLGANRFLGFHSGIRVTPHSAPTPRPLNANQGSATWTVFRRKAGSTRRAAYHHRFAAPIARAQPHAPKKYQHHDVVYRDRDTRYGTQGTAGHGGEREHSRARDTLWR